jgi:hypothetical protein
VNFWVKRPPGVTQDIYVLPVVDEQSALQAARLAMAAKRVRNRVKG